MTARIPVLLGIDSGQTAGKAALFTLDGRQVAVASVPTRVSHPHPRWAERELDDVWEQLTRAIRQVLADAPGVDVLAIGCCGHNDGAYLLDDRLRPVRPGILATDTRAHRYAEAIGNGDAAKASMELTGQVPFAASPAALLAWLRDHEPESAAATRWSLFCKDWIRLRLTGAVATDTTEASASFLHLVHRTWSMEALDLFGLRSFERALPPILDSTAVAGHVTADAAASTGLLEGTPVVAGAHDVDAAALGVGAIDAGAASVVLGTFSINQVVGDRPELDPRWQARAFLTPRRWLHMSTSPAGATNLDWVTARLGRYTTGGSADVAAAIEAAADAPLRADSPIFLPFLYGSPHGAALGASFAGLRGWHTDQDLVRATLEGVAFNHRTHFDALRERFDLRRPVRVCGGGTRSTAWTQLLADVLGLPLEVTDVSDASAQGAALLAGVGVGAFADLDDAVRAAVRVVRVHEADPAAAELHEQRYRTYRAIVEAMRAALTTA